MSLECETHLRGDNLHTIGNHTEALWLQDGPWRKKKKKSIKLWEWKQVIFANRVEMIEVNKTEKC